MPMNLISKNIKTTNLEFYENAYYCRNLITVWLKQFISYDQISKTRRNMRMLRDLIRSSKQLSVLDYGFGYGTLLFRIPRRHQISGCEISSEAIRNIKKLFTLMRRKVFLYSPNDFEVASQELSLNIVCCSHVIEHVDDEVALLKLFHSALGAGGYLLLNVPINEVWRDPKHIRQYTMESTLLLLERSGFEIIRTLEADRWTGFILDHEYVSAVRYKFLFRVLRLLLVLLPTAAQDTFERLLPEKYKFQQLLVLARKI